MDLGKGGFVEGGGAKMGEDGPGRPWPPGLDGRALFLAALGVAAASLAALDLLGGAISTGTAVATGAGAVLVCAAALWGEACTRRGVRRTLQGLEDRCERLRGELEALHSATLNVTAQAAYLDVLHQIVKEAARLSGARYGALAEFDAQEGVLEFVTYGVPQDIRERIGLAPTHRGLLRRLSGPEAVGIEDIQADPLFTGFPDAHPQFRTFIGTPIRFQGELLGHLYLGSHEGERPFGLSEQRLLELFALHAAVAIAQGRKTREQLHLVRVSERRELAMKLHDGTLQALYAVGIQMDRISKKAGVDTASAKTTAMALEAIGQAMGAVRQTLDALDRGEGEPVSDLIMSSVMTMALLYDLKVTWSGLGQLASVPASWAGDLGLFLAEVASNAARHGHAKNLHISVATEDGRLFVVAADDGSGMDPKEAERMNGRGLKNLDRRAQRLGGTFAIGGAPGKGVTVRLDVAEGLVAAQKGVQR